VLAQFAAFLKEQRLAALVEANLREVLALDLPALRRLPGSELRRWLRGGLDAVLDDLAAGRAVRPSELSERLLDACRLPGLPVELFAASDVVQLNGAQRRAVVEFIPRFTRDVNAAFELLAALDKGYRDAQTLAFQVTQDQRDDFSKLSEALTAEIVERKEIEQKLARHAMRLHMLAQTSSDLTQIAVDPRTCMTLFARRVSELLDATCTIHLVSEDGERLDLAGEHGADPQRNAGLVAGLPGESIPLELHPLYPFEQPHWRPEAAMEFKQTRSSFGRSSLQLAGVRSWIAVPLRSRERLMGVVMAVRFERTCQPFDDEDFELMQDLAERAVLALENASLYAEMERRVEARTRELHLLNQELEAFSYSVSHDLRAPLRAIDGFSLALLEDQGERLDEEGRGYLQRVRAATARMGELIDAMIEMARLARQPLMLQRVDLTAIATTVLDDLRAAQPELAVEIHVEEDLWADGDPRLLRNVLQNLLGNAWKYSSRRPHPHITFALEQIDGEPTYVVRDNGVGFDMAFAEKLFRPFARLHGRGEFEGSGVGLATVQRIIARHGGRIWGRGVPGEGATFGFTLGSASVEEASRPYSDSHAGRP
jgi:signal transduction histidine kinase